jgi:capsular exopolysaccharide synthesis family protein
VQVGDFVAVVWRRRWLVVWTLAAALGVALLITLLQPRTYEATATVRVATVSGTPGTEVRRDDLAYTDRLVNTYRTQLRSRPVKAELARRLGRATAPEIVIETPANTELLRISARDGSPEIAARAANQLAAILIANVRRSSLQGGQSGLLRAQLTQTRSDLNAARSRYASIAARAPGAAGAIRAASEAVSLYEARYASLQQEFQEAQVVERQRANNVTVVEPAVPPQHAASPNVPLNMGLGLLVGLAGGLALAVIVDRRDTRLRTSARIGEEAGAAVLGEIPWASPDAGRGVFNSRSPEEEAFRRLRTNLLALADRTPTARLLFTSAETGEGTTTVVANLASMLARGGWSVVAVDGNLRAPALHEALGLRNEDGLGDVLLGRTSVESAVRVSPVDGVRLMSAGRTAVGPGELLGSPEMARVVAELAERFGLVLIDSPSLLSAPDAGMLIPAVDGVVLVVHRPRATAEAVRAASRQLAMLHAVPLVVVVNMTEDGGRRRPRPSPDDEFEDW